MTKASDIDRQAADWLIQLDSHESPDKWAALDAWLSANPRHRAAFLRLSVAWRRADQLKKLRPFTGAVDADLLSPAAQRVLSMWGEEDDAPAHVRWRHSRRALGLAAAAAIAAVAIGAAAWFTALPSLPQPDVYQTELGGKKTIPLADGSTVELNTDSVLQVLLTPDRRMLKLVRGEALFKVAHNYPARPFDVVAGATTVRAIGTEFSVRLHDPSHVEVVVAEGRVALVPPRKPPTLGAGDAITLNHGSVTFVSLAKPDVERRHAWTQGRLSFQGETLAEAAAQFNRYNRRKIEIAAAEIAGLPVGGSFKVTDVDNFVRALEETFPVRAVSQDGQGRHGVIRLHHAGP